MPTLHVTLPDCSYPIFIEPGGVSQLGDRTRAVSDATSILLAVDANVLAGHGRAARTSLTDSGFNPTQHVLIAEEQRKTLDAVHRIYDAMLTERLDRTSAVVAVGGGVIGDVAGFAAATYLRGVPVIQVPTTLLAMVDASVGGKTGVNHPRPADADGHRALGKNLIGAFWQPRAVVIDPNVLETLAPRHFRCGLAECVKHGMIADAGIISFIEANLAGIEAHEPAVLVELIARCVAVKIDVVEQDERETGRRALLNLGHTFAHAIEPIGELDLRHGEAVSIGLCAAAAVGVALGRYPVDEAQRVATLLDRIGLPTRIPRSQPLKRLLEAMRYDKKVAGGRMRLIVPCGAGAAEVYEDADRELLETAWSAVGVMR